MAGVISAASDFSKEPRTRAPSIGSYLQTLGADVRCRGRGEVHCGSLRHPLVARSSASRPSGQVSTKAEELHDRSAGALESDVYLDELQPASHHVELPPCGVVLICLSAPSSCMTTPPLQSETRNATLLIRSPLTQLALKALRACRVERQCRTSNARAHGCGCDLSSAAKVRHSASTTHAQADSAVLPVI
jgi:hypothetical protein